MKARIIIGLSLFLLVGGVHGQELNRDSVPNARIYSGASEYTSFPGGMPRLKRFVEKNFNYPKEAWGEANRLSNSDLHFIVRRDGVACGLDGKDMHPAVYEEWKRVFRLMPLWEPAKIKGHPVDVKCHTRLHVYDQSSGLPFHIERGKNKLMKKVGLGREYRKGLICHDAEVLEAKMDEFIFYDSAQVDVLAPLVKTCVSLGKYDKAVVIAENGLKKLHEQMERKMKNPRRILRFDGKVYLDAALTYMLACDVAGEREKARKAYEYALDVADWRILLQDINVRKKPEYGNEMYRRLLAEKQVLATTSRMPGVTLDASERAAMFNHGWVTSESQSAIDRNVKAGKIDNPRIRQINAQLEEMRAERCEGAVLGKDSLYLYGLHALAIELGEGGEAVNRYVVAMQQRADVSPKLKSYLSKLLKKRQKHASLLDNRRAVIRCLAEYAPIVEEGESKVERKQRAQEFYRYRNAVKSVYPLEWLWHVVKMKEDSVIIAI